MRKDPTEFRKRFAAYKAGKKPYDAGRPVQDTFDGGELPEVVVTGYAPMRLTTYYIGDDRYPFTGHSKLEIPIESDVWYNYVGENSPNDQVSPYVSIDKTMRAKDYNLITNNCADETLNYLNKAFSTTEKPFLFTSPGDVRDYAIKQLGGKLIKNSDGSDTVLIPRNKINAKKTSETALDLFNKDATGIFDAGYRGRFDSLPGYGGGKGAFGLMPIDITSTLRNLYRAAKNRAYRTITPQDYNIPKATRLFISGKNRDKQKISPIRNEEWARYLGVPYEGESGFEPSPYRPLKGKTYNTVLRFKDESEILSDQVLNQMIEHQRKTGKNSLLVEGNGGGLGSYTLSLGEDKQGKYISYYDDWDINPFKGISSKVNIPIISNIEDIIPGSNPYTVYGRRYYTEGDVKNLRKNNTRNEPRNK